MGLSDLPRLPALDLADRAAAHQGPVLPMPGAPIVPMPEHVVEAVRRQQGLRPARESRGTLALRSALAQMLRDRDHVQVDPDTELLITHGAGHGMSVVLGAFCGPGDEVVVPAPSYFFDGAIARTGARPRYVVSRAETGWALDLDAIESAITPRARAVIVCNPVNPTGRLHEASEIDALVRLAERYGVLLISDESFSRYAYDGPFVAAASRAADRRHVVTVQSLSKNYAFADWRVGYVHGAPQLIEAVHRCFEWDAINVGSVPQAAALAAITGPQHWVESLIARYQDKRDLMMDLLASAGIEPVRPGAGAAIFTPIPRPERGRALEDLLLGHGVAAIAGGSFHGPDDHVRLLFGGEPTDLIRLGAALDAAVRAAKGTIW